MLQRKMERWSSIIVLLVFIGLKLRKTRALPWGVPFPLEAAEVSPAL
jgi:hypothetical protein